MGNWNDVLNEIRNAGSTHDIVRRTCLSQFQKASGRNIIAYYSGWLQKGQLARQGVRFEITDGDKQGFMSAVHGLDKSLGLDLILHTPGGEISATESLVDYLRAMFGSDIRVIVPQLAMSAGTMIALSAKEIIMGKHSSLGPIDPQIGGMPAHGIIEEFERAKTEITTNPASIPIWQPIIAKYPPTLVGEAQKAIDWATEMVEDWLKSGMFASAPDSAVSAQRVVEELGDHALTKSHSRHISFGKAQQIGLNVSPLESDPIFQDLALTVHHSFMLTLSATPAIKIIENHNGVAYIETVG